MTEKRRKELVNKFAKLYGKPPSALEFDQALPGLVKPKKGLWQIKVRNAPHESMREQLSKMELQRKVKRLEKASSWFEHFKENNPEAFTKSKEEEHRLQRAEAIIFMREKLELAFDEISKTTEVGLSTVRWIYNRYKE